MSMKNEKELRLLRYFENSIASGSSHSNSTGFRIWLCRLLGIAGVGFGMVLSAEPAIPVSVSVLLAAIGGFLLGAVIYAQKCIEQLSVIKDHVTSDSIKSRIRDIDK